MHTTKEEVSPQCEGVTPRRWRREQHTRAEMERASSHMTRHRPPPTPCVGLPMWRSRTKSLRRQRSPRCVGRDRRSREGASSRGADPAWVSSPQHRCGTGRPVRLSRAVMRDGGGPAAAVREGLIEQAVGPLPIVGPLQDKLLAHCFRFAEQLHAGEVRLATSRSAKRDRVVDGFGHYRPRV